MPKKVLAMDAESRGVRESWWTFLGDAPGETLEKSWSTTVHSLH
jgi:hypothetical protein